ncbi:hypothetical protein [Absidia glauca]|uniref:Uncharacterized protein n=1 Tax=Absidia glauca TaxID=4829 RepID=A0A168PUF6_ABSGL|nr:hypothetical protein [Absidia glauca]
MARPTLPRTIQPSLSTLNTKVDLKRFSTYQEHLQCPNCFSVSTLTISKSAISTRSTKFNCTNAHCPTRIITPSQISIAIANHDKRLKYQASLSSSNSTDTNVMEPSATNATPENALPPVTTVANDSFEPNLAIPAFDQTTRTTEQLVAAIAELSTLKAQLLEKDLIIEQQQQEISALKDSLTTSPIPTVSPGLVASKHSPNGDWANQARVQQLQSTLATAPTSRALKKQQAAARQFTAPSLNQGFQHLYVPVRARLRIGQVRQYLKQLKVDNNRILDINYPAMNTVAFLVHNDYVDELKLQLSKAGLQFLDNFDPLAQQHLNDPKYKDRSIEERTNLAKEHHLQRMQRSLDFIREPVKFAVARCFASKGWISADQLATILQAQQSQGPLSAFVLADGMDHDDPADDDDDHSNAHTYDDDQMDTPSNNLANDDTIEPQQCY